MYVKDAKTQFDFAISRKVSTRSHLGAPTRSENDVLDDVFECV